MDVNIHFVLGATHMVYPGAVHSRFEHSLGVYWLAGEAVERLKTYQVQSYIELCFTCFNPHNCDSCTDIGKTKSDNSTSF